jgi:hypothetical protein
MLDFLEDDVTDIILGFCVNAPEARLLSKAYRDEWNRLHPDVLKKPPSICPFLLMPQCDESDAEGSSGEADEEHSLTVLAQDVASDFHFTKAQSAIIARYHQFRSDRRLRDSLGLHRPETILAVHLARAKLRLDHGVEKARATYKLHCETGFASLDRAPSDAMCHSLHLAASVSC